MNPTAFGELMYLGIQVAIGKLQYIVPKLRTYIYLQGDPYGRKEVLQKRHVVVKALSNESTTVIKYYSSIRWGMTKWFVLGDSNMQLIIANQFSYMFLAVVLERAQFLCGKY